MKKLKEWIILKQDVYIKKWVFYINKYKKVKKLEILIKSIKYI